MVKIIDCMACRFGGRLLVTADDVADRRRPILWHRIALLQVVHDQIKDTS